MSFLNITVPVETLTSLIGDVSSQIDAERLECCEDYLSEIDRPTTELKRLAEILKENTGVRTSLDLMVNSYVDAHIILLRETSLVQPW
jgi:hypothetical protein